MKKLQECQIDYLGYQSPESPDQINLEILGLKNAIAKANERVSALEQSLLIAKVFIKEKENDVAEVSRS